MHFILKSVLSVVLCYVYLSHGLSEDDFGTGTVELVRRSRTSRLNKDFLKPEEDSNVNDEFATRNEYKAKVMAEYQKLMEMNPKNLTAQQKQLLESIVTRAARLGGIDVSGAGEGRAQKAATVSSATQRPTSKGSTKGTAPTTKRTKQKSSAGTHKPSTTVPTVAASSIPPTKRHNDTLASKLAHPPNTTLPVQVREDIFSPELNATAIMDTLSRNNEQPELYKQTVDIKKKVSVFFL